MNQAFIYDGGRTAFGRHGGCLSSTRPDDLLAHAIKNVVERNPFDPKFYEDVIGVILIRLEKTAETLHVLPDC